VQLYHYLQYTDSELTPYVRKHIDYAKSKSYATQKREDPNFVPPHAANASSLLLNGAKRQREEDSAVVGRDAKNQKTDSDGSDDEEMEIDEDDELPLKHSITCMSYLSNTLLFHEHSSFVSRCYPIVSRRSHKTTIVHQFTPGGHRLCAVCIAAKVCLVVSHVLLRVMLNVSRQS